MLYNYSVADRLLGCYLQKPELCLNTKYPIKKEEFQVLFHRIIYATVYNLSIQGCKEVTIMDVDQFVKPYQSEYNVLQDNSFEDYIINITQLSSLDNFEYYYNEFRKMSCLNKYKEEGFDITKFYDEEKTEESQLENLNQYSLDDIVNYYDKIATDVKNEYLVDDTVEQMICGEDWEETLKEFEEDPMIGAGLCSPMLNSLYRGWCKGHLILRGAPSSFGKTLFGIADQVNVSCLKLWSDEQQCFVDNPYYQGKGAYIHTEQKMEKEIQPRFISTISGVPYHKILDGNFTAEEKERLRIAGEIARESGLMIINMPQFTAESLRQKIKSLALQGYEYITFDYVWNNFYIVSELKKINGGSSVREDQALLHLVDTLKMSAEEFDVGISTMIQLNGREKEVEIVDESCLFGSKSVKTKLDNGSIFMYPRKKELKQVEMLVEKWNHKNNTKFGKQIIPNGVSHCFKTRYSRYGQNIKIWHYLDKSIGRVVDMFATTAENYPIDIPMMYIEGKKEV